MLAAVRNKLYDTSQINKDKKLFTNKALWALLVPIMIEQLLNSFMGMADTMMVSSVGSAAISAVSLVDSINSLVLQVFSAMAAGAVIVCSQCLGRSDEKRCNKAARQVVLAMLVISITLMLIGIMARGQLLHIIFGNVEEDVMDNSMVYFLISVVSYPFIALFNAGSAFYRASGNSKFPMKVSVISNIMNIIGNMILIFVFKMGVAGAALATLFSRAFNAIVIFYFLRKPKQTIVIKDYFKIRPDFALIGTILAIGIPSGIENGMFQFGKLMIQSTVSELGTIAIAAQAMTNILENVNGIAGISIGIGLMTVVGQCMGAGRKEEAKYYIVKLTGYAEIAVIISCLVVLLITKPVTALAKMEVESAKLCFEMVTFITIVKPISWALSFIPAYGMRAAGDVKFSMILSSLTMWLCRVALCVYLCKVWGFGPIAVWIGMFADWTLRGIMFTLRFLSSKWAEHSII